jgi:uncharacterized protein
MASALLGGALIGAAATLYWLGTGQAAGISGILGGALRGSGEGMRWHRLVFLAGLIGAGVIASWITAAPAAHPRTLVVLIVAGVLVGFGTRVGGGCTSGHGVCGISRFSLRSVVATLLFMATGALTVYLLGSGGAP